MDEMDDLNREQINDLTDVIESQSKVKTFEKNKKGIYIDERKEVLKRLYEILQITDTNKIFFSDIVERPDITYLIMGLEDDVKKYYNVSTWASFKKNVTLKNGRSLSMVKSILKDMNIDLEKLNTRIRRDPKEDMIYTTQYRIL
jgi:hypothetical protein